MNNHREELIMFSVMYEKGNLKPETGNPSMHQSAITTLRERVNIPRKVTPEY
jgi:hypothetical protein